jgi:hypothetical protein
MKRGGLDVYNDQSSEEFLCDASSGTSGREYNFEVLEALRLIVTE